MRRGSISSSDDPSKPIEAGGVEAQCYARKVPSMDELRNIVAAARRYSADRAASESFHVSCNLLSNSASAAVA